MPPATAALSSFAQPRFCRQASFLRDSDDEKGEKERGEEGKKKEEENALEKCTLPSLGFQLMLHGWL